jgi:hypothetical protein
MLAMTLWLLMFGVDVPNWQKRTVAMQPKLVRA